VSCNSCRTKPPTTCPLTEFRTIGPYSTYRQCPSLSNCVLPASIIGISETETNVLRYNENRQWQPAECIISLCISRTRIYARTTVFNHLFLVGHLLCFLVLKITVFLESSPRFYLMFFISLQIFKMAHLESQTHSGVTQLLLWRCCSCARAGRVDGDNVSIGDTCREATCGHGRCAMCTIWKNCQCGCDSKTCSHYVSSPMRMCERCFKGKCIRQDIRDPELESILQATNMRLQGV